MSGLTVFFNGFLPKGWIPTYEQSTASLMLERKGREDKERGPEGDGGNNKPSAMAAVTMPPNKEEEEGMGWTEPVSFKEWKSIEKEVLNTYLQHRIVVPDDEDEESSPSSPRRTSKSHETESQSPSQDSEVQFETQQPFQGDDDDDDVHEQNGDKSDQIVEQSRPPHVDAAIHAVSYLTDVDLHSKQVDLKLLTVERSWYFRKTMRPATSNVVPRRQPMIEIYQGPVKVPLHPCQDDGPLCCVYRHVLSLEVTQYDKPSSNLRQRAAAVQGTPIRRLKVFVYNGYAEALNTVVQKVHQKVARRCRLMLQLRNIPAQCIFPVPMTSWVDFDVSQYCICLGDKSQMQRQEEDGTVSLLRFDSPQVEVSAAILDGDHIVEEWKICGGSDVVITNVSSEERVIGPAYQEEQSGRARGGGSYYTLGSSRSPSGLLSKQKPSSSSKRRTSASPAPKASSSSKQPPPLKDAPTRTSPAEREKRRQAPVETNVAQQSDTERDSLSGTPKKRRVINADGPTNQSNSARKLPLQGDPGDRQTDKGTVYDGVGDQNRSKGQEDETNTPEEASKQTTVEKITVDKPQQGTKRSPSDHLLGGGTTQTRGREYTHEVEGVPSHDEPSKTSGRHQDESDVENDLMNDETNRAASTAVPLTPMNENGAHDDTEFNSTPFRIIQEDGKGKDTSSPARNIEKESLHYHKLVRGMARLKRTDLTFDSLFLYCVQGELANHLKYHKDIAREEGTKVKCIVNVFAVVIGFGSPAMTKRGEWMMSVALVDDSLPLDDEEDSLKTVNVNIFAKDKLYLPKIRFGGDVLRLHRVQVQEWNENLQLLGLRASSFVVCRKEFIPDENDFGWTLLPTSRSHFEVSGPEKKKFAGLWKWGQHRFSSFPTMNSSKRFKLADVQRQDSQSVESLSDENSRGDSTVMVTAIIPADERLAYPRGFLRVWDGTGPPICDPLFNLGPQALESVANGDPPDKALVRLAEVVEKVQYLRPSQPPLSAPIAVTGRVVNVAVWDDSHWELVNEVVRVGTFIRLRNVQENRVPESDLRCVMVHTKSYMTPLPDTAFEIVHLLEEHNARLKRKDELNPSSGVLPAQDLEDANLLAQPAGTAASLRTPQRAASPNRRSPKRRKIVNPFSKDFSVLLSGDFPVNFKGIVSIVGTIPAYPVLAKGGAANIITKKHSFGVKLEDSELNQIDVVVNPHSDAAQAILGGKTAPADDLVSFALSFLREAIKNRWCWVAEIRGIIIDGGKYYTLDSIAKYDE